VRFYFTGTKFLYDYNANLSKAIAAKKLPLTILWKSFWRIEGGRSVRGIRAGPWFWRAANETPETTSQTESTGRSQAPCTWVVTFKDELLWEHLAV